MVAVVVREMGERGKKNEKEEEEDEEEKRKKKLLWGGVGWGGLGAGLTWTSANRRVKKTMKKRGENKRKDKNVRKK